MAVITGNKQLIERFIRFGLTRQEATIYIFLLSHGSLTGYEVSKLTGISRSNVYTALNSLAETGAAYQISGSPSKYVAVPAVEYCNNKLQGLSSDRDYILANLPNRYEENDGYITISGDSNILDKARNILIATKHRVYLSVPQDVLINICSILEDIVEQGIKLVMISDYDPVSLIPSFEQKLNSKGRMAESFDTAESGVFYYSTSRKVSDIRLISDSSYCLTGEYGNGNSSCLYSGQHNFVNVLKEALRNEILLNYREK